MNTAYRTVCELDDAEILELKTAYLEQLRQEYEEYTDPEDIPDSVILEHYDGCIFSDDDFFCNAEDGKLARQKKLFIDGKRSGYAPEQCGETLTVGQLRQALNKAVEWGGLTDDMPIYLCNDSGYTYGEINDYSSFMIGTSYEDIEDFDIRMWID